MTKRHTYDTASEAINDLIRRGYTTELTLLADKNCIICNHSSVELSPNDFEIDEIYRFEGNTDPGDEMIVFGVSSEKHKVKGVLVNAFGVYSENTTSDITKKLQMHI
ncbi:MAG TPA: phosphoribosylpyrophosphate synthetase [Salegentibacter sp.]|uniref:phosphoribosylpyrophosphate synthetase n=1 Tax=Salegentibacter sp. TaxID=1903072 RepID=UPI002F922EAC